VEMKALLEGCTKERTHHLEKLLQAYKQVIKALKRLQPKGHDMKHNCCKNLHCQTYDYAHCP
jgi:hypothetical protein